MKKTQEQGSFKHNARPGKGGLLLALFRHGPAAERNATLYPNDDQRPLTPAGRKRVKASARGLRKLGFTPDKLLFSPALRTRETAGILADVFKLAPEAVRMEPALHIDTDPVVLVRQTLRTEPPGKVMWVGHEPWLGEAIALLTGGAVALRKAAVALVDIPPGTRGKGVLRGLVPPEWLAAMVRAG
jgi:phosphohistidine phosphatase